MRRKDALHPRPGVAAFDPGDVAGRRERDSFPECCSADAFQEPVVPDHGADVLFHRVALVRDRPPLGLCRASYLIVKATDPHDPVAVAQAGERLHEPPGGTSCDRDYR
jgi:hypothetical protein